MRFKVFKIIATLLSELTGIGCLVVAFFAFQLGLDNNITLGTMRKILCGLGVLLFIAPVVVYVFKRLFSNIKKPEFFLKLSNKWKDYLKASTEIGNTTIPRKTILNSSPFIWCSLGVLIVFFCSLWYLSSGRLLRFNFYSDYYNLQADGFLAGQTSLLIEPSKDLLELADPYDWHARVGIETVWDASLYQGKYYIYWGPVPALIAALVKTIKPVVVQDQFLLFFFVIALTIVWALLLAFIRKKFFPAIPAWTLTFLILVQGLSTPVFWLVNRPNVYETAIASCQFFLFLGLYGLIRGLVSNNSRPGWFLLAGISLGAAVGSRTSIVVTVFFIVSLALWRLFKKGNQSKTMWQKVILLLLPMVLIAGGLAWFNYDRFGSIFETGLMYQLTGDALPEDPGNLFSLRNVLPNVYLSLLQPFKFTPNEFPFFIATIDNNWTRIISMPKDYYFAEQVTGILWTIPFLLFLVIPVIQMIRRGWWWLKEIPFQPRINSGEPLPKWLWVLTIGSALIAFGTNMMFIMTTMRYLADFSPLLILVSSLVVMRELDYVRNIKLLSRLLLIMLVIFVIITMTIALFINFMSGDRRMLNENPALYARLEQFFNR